MRRYNAEFRESMLKKVFTRPDDVSISQIALEANMPNETLFGWIKKSERGAIKMKKEKYTNELRFQFCVAYFSLPEHERGEYLRSNGLYSYELDNWKKEFINNQFTPDPNKNDQANKKKIKELQKELRRKEKALAETATLLTLKKKYQEIFEDEE
jgi:transposase